jgi:FtsP/CotA-like multicopper oxidase with cupredoxin domain
MSDRRLSRRKFLGLGAAGAGGLLLQYGLRQARISTSDHLAHHQSAAPGLIFREAGSASASALASPTVKRFQVPLPIPKVHQPSSSDATTDYYEISAKVNRQEILPGLMTTIWGYDGEYPGKTFSARRGRRMVVKVTNELPEPISCHYHGGVTAPEHDGYAEDIVLNGVTMPTLIRPGKSWTYEYTNEQGACTNWFHDHAIHKTAEHVYRGMASFYLVRDDEEASFNLPQGEFEIPLVFQDRLFTSSGELVYDNNSHAGVEGDVQLVNGAPWPRLQVQARKYRFRMLVGTNWRRYDFALSHSLKFIQIGTDSGFLRAPLQHSMLRMYGAERNDVIVDFSQVPVGTTVYLYNKAKEAIGTKMEQVMAFEVVASALDDSQVPTQLSSYENLTTSSAIAKSVATRQFVFERTNGYYAINGKIWDPKRFDGSPRLGTTEIWKLVNKSGGWFHPIHIHLINFQVLSRGEIGKPGKPWAWETGRKDVVAVPENSEVNVIIKWDAHEYRNFTGPYMMHCHNVDHEDHDMMTQFKVLPPA